jgi:hypothetical protein
MEGWGQLLKSSGHSARAGFISGLDGLATANQLKVDQPEQLAMLRRADSSDVDAIVAFEADVMNRKLYGRPLVHFTDRSASNHRGGRRTSLATESRA